MVETELLKIVEVIGNLISEKVQDIKKDRVKEGGRWVFPTFPESDSVLPQVTVDLRDPVYEDNSAGDFFYEETLDNGDHKVYFYKKGIYPVHIFVITNKKDEFKIYHDKEELFLTNKPLNLYLTGNVRNTLWLNRKELLTHFENFKILSIVTPFENTENSWASDMTCEIETHDIFVRTYREGELVSEYALTINTY